MPDILQFYRKRAAEIAKDVKRYADPEYVNDPHVNEAANRMSEAFSAIATIQVERETEAAPY